MPFIAIDLKVIESTASAVGRVAGVDEDRVLAGLVRLWHRVWSTSCDTVNVTQLGGVFGVKRLSDLVHGLIDFEFLERSPNDPDLFRVRGAERYLRLKESRREGARKTNAKRWGGKTDANHELSLNVAQRSLSDGISDSVTGIAAVVEIPGRSKAIAQRSLEVALSPNTEEEIDRGSMSSPLLAHRVKPTEGKNSQGDVSEATGFVVWARTQHDALAEPGPGAYDWAHNFFEKFQPSDPQLIRLAFARFLVWAKNAGKTPGWGLWLSERVWEPRWAEVRAEASARLEKHTSR